MVDGMNGRRDRSPMRERERRDRPQERRGGPPRDRSGPSGPPGGRRPRSERRLYVSNIPFDFRWQELKDLFRREVGEVAYVEVFSDANGKSRGAGIIEFDSQQLVDLALDKMHRFDLNGRNIVVKEDFGVERDNFGYLVHTGGMGAGGGGGGGGPMRGEGRDMPRERRNFGGGDRAGMDIPLGEKYPNTYGLNVSFLESLGIDGPLVNRVFVANLDYKVDDKKLKEVFGLAGKVVKVTINKDREGGSKGHGVIEFDHPVEAVQAISMLNNQNYMDRPLSVRMDRAMEKREREPVATLPSGLKGIGLGLGSCGVPLTDVATKLIETAQAQAVAPTLPTAATAAAQMGGISGFPTGVATNNGAAAAAALGLMGTAPNQPTAGLPGMSAPAAMGLGGMQASMAAAGGLQAMPGAAAGMTQMPIAMQQQYAALAGSSQMMRGTQPNMGGAAEMRAAGGSMDRRGQYGYGGSNGNGSLGGGGGMDSSYGSSSRGGMNTAYGSSSRSSMDTAYGSSSRGGMDSGYGSSSRGGMDSGYGSSSRGGMDSAYGSSSRGGIDSGYGSSSRGCTDSIIISNLDPLCSWQALREKFRDIGEVRFADMKGKGVGIVRFGNANQAQRAISLMDGSRADGRVLDVRPY